LVLAGTALEVSIFICEIPTGLSLMLQSPLVDCDWLFPCRIAFLFQATTPTFVGVILFMFMGYWIYLHQRRDRSMDH